MMVFSNNKLCISSYRTNNKLIVIWVSFNEAKMIKWRNKLRIGIVQYNIYGMYCKKMACELFKDFLILLYHLIGHT